MASDLGTPVPPLAAVSQKGPGHLAAAFPKGLSLASRSVHADDYINNHQAVAPPMHVSTTFRYSENPDDLVPDSNINPAAPHDSHVYSRHTAPNTTRLEAVLTSILGGPAVTYSSGLAAFHALLVFLNPKRIAISGGYHGCHGVIQMVAKLSGLQQLDLLSDDDLDTLQSGDIIHVETPLNPTGEARNLEYYRKKADTVGAYLIVDATFAPPPLMEPFAYGVDVVMHSGTKYFGGHSDLLSGVLAVNPSRVADNEKWVERLKDERVFLGSVMGNMEGWLGVRSLRTLELRVKRQSESATALVSWLISASSPRDNEDSKLVAESVSKVQHASIQPEAAEEGSWLRKQMPNGYGPVFSLILASEDDARRLPSKLHLFHHATSLGGVESLIEWRAMSDPFVDRRLLRVSVGVENVEDLKEDILQGFRALRAEKEEKAVAK
ncbi:Cys/Met metabolism PLP-dependent enzyme-domain-containing protein [Podospora didyma]|uniref:Cys/Met metabolism PLP-dependent enzyme-domain-containing protein n=1 Tax=Podospora didyma TaxID=330526 RepID=A0AAE0P657_9PEZI|nr:Cys/Met metabolism PLP-dependent enzyme-domain-containing protein [Podospora didyma]